MLKLRFLIAFLCFSVLASAQKRDSLFVSYEHNMMVIHHPVSTGETILSLAKSYHVPAAVLADANGLTFQDALDKRKKVLVPLGPYNYITRKPSKSNKSKPLYYRVTAKDNLYRISKQAGLDQQDIQDWNDMVDKTITPGQSLLMGWVDYTKSDLQNPSVSTPPALPAPPRLPTTLPSRSDKIETQVIIIKKPDTVRKVVGLEKIYLSQTNNEQNVVEEKGTAVFFTSAGKVSSSNVFFAFHNTAPTGSVIKVYNPGTEKSVFVKVLGPVPGTKQYHNAIIGIGSGAKEVLGINNERAWVELKYVGY
ncbi:MAG: LysM peptidoglycan-binding domain-containing protein [Sphingobacteriales bacterium]|nr:MAG: LysM peptidoglycan-binding domain-containing protein [Sphingobacteriales bacterium]